ncbi:MAG: TetR/AcrR family transcriptional regulator [Patulibacter minatonensis]
MASSTADGSGTSLREALLDAAEIEVGASGAGGASLRAVARRARVSHQAPAYAFTNRRGMLTALATRYVERLGEHLTHAVANASDRPPLEQLVEVGMAYVEFSGANPGLFSLTASPDQIDIDDPALSAAREASWSILHDVVVEAQREGWRAHLPAEGVALTCWVLVHGSAALWREGWLAAQFPRAELRELVRGVLLSVI